MVQIVFKIFPEEKFSHWVIVCVLNCVQKEIFKSGIQLNISKNPLYIKFFCENEAANCRSKQSVKAILSSSIFL